MPSRCHELKANIHKKYVEAGAMIKHRPEIEGYLYVDTKSDIIVSLLHCRKCLLACLVDKQEWKWVLLSAHNALQGLLVLTLSGTDGTGVLDKNSRKLALAWYEKRNAKKLNFIKKKDENGFDVKVPADIRPFPKGDAYPDVRVASLMNLVGKAEKKFKFKIDQICKRDLYSLNEFRNTFMHFKPRHSWWLEIEGLPRMVNNSIEMMNQIVQKANSPILRLSDLHRPLSELAEALNAAQGELYSKTFIR